MKVQPILLLHREFKGINLDDANRLSRLLDDIPGELSQCIIGDISKLDTAQERTALLIVYIDKIKNLRKKVDFRMLVADDYQIEKEAIDNLAFSFREKLLNNSKLHTKQVFKKSYKNIPFIRLTKSEIDKIIDYKVTPDFWIKKINQTVAQNRDIIASKLGFMGEGKKYTCVTESTLREFKKSFLKQERFRQKKIAVNVETGDYFHLSDTKSPKDSAVTEATCVLNGLARYAVKVDYCCIFVTMTLPARSRLSNEKSPLGPIELNDKLKNIWSDYNSKRSQLKSPSYVFRVIEAHADGTPHWHLIMFFTKKSSAKHKNDFFDAFGLITSTKSLRISWKKIELPKDNPSGKAIKVEPIGYLVKKIQHEFTNNGSNIKMGNPNAINAAYMRLWGFNNYDFLGLPQITRALWRELRSDHYPVLPQELQDVREKILNNTLPDFSNFADFFDFLVKNKEAIEISTDTIKPNKTPSIVGIKWKNVEYLSNKPRYKLSTESHAIPDIEEKSTYLTINSPRTSHYERLLTVLTQIQLLKMNVSDGLPAVEHNENYVDTSKRLKSETSLFLKKFLNLVKIIYRVIFLKSAGLIFSKIAPFFK